MHMNIIIKKQGENLWRFLN